MEKISVWILFSVANDYNQPDAAFEKLWWEKPTAEVLGKEMGLIPNCDTIIKLLEGETVTDGSQFWLSEIVK